MPVENATKAWFHLPGLFEYYPLSPAVPCASGVLLRLVRDRLDLWRTARRDLEWRSHQRWHSRPGEGAGTHAGLRHLCPPHLQ